MVSTFVAMVRPNDNNTADATEPTLRCPYCRYDLTGLPGPHRCPECGFEYGEGARSWESPYFGNQRITKFVFRPIGLFVGIWCMVNLLGWLRNKPAGGGLVLELDILVIWATVAAIGALYHARTFPIVYLDHRRIIFGERRSRLRTMPLADIWIPHPDERIVIPPWLGVQWKSSRQELPWRIWDGIWLGKIYLHQPMHVFIRPPEWSSAVGATQLFWYGDFPRRTRREIMLDIYQQWRDWTSVGEEGESASKSPQRIA